MSLRKLCRKIILRDIIQALKKEHEWKVLVLDDMALRIISSCCTTEEILKENIAIIELANKEREPLKQFEAIYILEATYESIEILNADFAPTKYLYDGAHIFFLEALPDSIFHKICATSLASYIKTIKEINISFLPVESQVFSLDYLGELTNFYGVSSSVISDYCDVLAEKIATLCCTLEEYPVIRFSRRYMNNALLANKIQKRLQVYYANFQEQMTVGTAQLLILDRGFDLTSPLIHEMTLQATAYDIFHIHDNIYQFHPQSGHDERNISLDETDPFWVEYRHEHLARLPEVMQRIMKNLTDPFDQPDNTRVKSDVKLLSEDVGTIVKLRLKKRYAGFQHLISECLECYATRLKPLCALEQDMATRCTPEGDKVEDPIQVVKNLLSREIFKKNEKLRIIILYILFMDGITERLLVQLITTAKLPPEYFDTIRAMSKLGCIPSRQRSDPIRPLVYRKDRSKTLIYKASRWVPVLKDVLELLIDDELDEHDFPFMSTKGTDTFQKRQPVWQRKESSENRTRAIIFIVGGLTYSEMRCAYEVTEENSTWEVIVGSDHIITPDIFIKDLQRETKEPQTQ